MERLGSFGRREAQREREKRGFRKLAQLDEEQLVQSLKNLADELGIRGVERLVQAARSRGMPNKGMAQYAKRARGQGHLQQVLKAPPVSGGAIAASAKNEVWQADLAHFKYGTASKYFLVVCDDFSRLTQAQAMTDATAESTVAAFKKCVAILGKPQLCSSDGGSEFQQAFSKYCRDEAIAQRISHPQDKTLFRS